MKTHLSSPSTYRGYSFIVYACRPRIRQSGGGILLFLFVLAILAMSGAWSPAFGDSAGPAYGTATIGTTPAAAGVPPVFAETFSWMPEQVRDFFGGIYNLLFAVGVDDVMPEADAVPAEAVLANGMAGEERVQEEESTEDLAEATVTPIPVDQGMEEPEEESPPLLSEPAADAEPTSQYGGVYIDSLPSGIPIILDGKTLNAETPKIIFGLSEGSHTVKISNEKKIFSIYEEKVWIYKGMLSSVKFDINPELKKKLNIKSDLFSGDQFTVNGKYPVYRVPTTITLNEPGCFLTILHNGSYITKEISDYLDPGATMAILPCEIQYGNIRAVSDPERADVLVDGFPTGLKTPCVVENLSQGRHIVTISKLGYRPSDNSLMMLDDPKSDVDAEIKVSLEPYAYGELTVTSTEKGARVVIEKLNFRRTTPCTFQYMNIGSYSMKVTQGGETRVVEFEIAPGVGKEYEFDVKEGTFITREYKI